MSSQPGTPNFAAGLEASLQGYFAIRNRTQQQSPHRLKLHPGQLIVRQQARRFNVMVMGRRFGKSMLESDLLVETAEQGYPAGYFAPTYKMLAEGWRELLAATEPIRVGKSEQEHRIETINKGVIECWSLDGEGAGSTLARRQYKAGRSRKYKRVCVDEAGLVPNLENIFNYAIAPTLIDLKGDAWFGGTPNGKGGFYRFYLKGQHKEDNPYSQNDWMSWQMPTRTNPYIPLEEIERAKLDYPDHVFRQEYEAEFLEDSGQVFRNIAACTAQKHLIWQEEALPYHVYLIAWDLAKKNDFSVLGVIDCTTKSLVHMDRFNHVEYMLQIPRLIALAEKFQPVEVVVEQNGNLALMEVLRQVKYKKRGPAPRISKNWMEYDDITLDQILMAEAVAKRLEEATNTNTYHQATLPINEFVVSNISKEEAIQALVLAFERTEINIPNDTVLLEELENFGMERLPSGKFRYAAQGDGHDDTVMMLAEGWYRARRYMSIEALPMREKVLRHLSSDLHPNRIAQNQSQSAYVSQEYYIRAYEQEQKKKQKTHFMSRWAGLGR